MKLSKGSIYKVTQEEWMMHDRAEYHSPFPSKVEGKTLHNMVIRMIDNDLEMELFRDEDIISVSEGGL